MKKPNGNTEVRLKSYWRSRTDDELLAIAFTTDDPENLPGLVQDVPAITDVIVELAYDFLGSKRRFLRCAHCKYPNHLAGFVIKTTDGQRFLCGHQCGEKIYGANFKAIKKDYDVARSRASDLRRWRNMQSALPVFLEYLEQLKQAPAFPQFQPTRQELRRKMPRLCGALRMAIERQNGQLLVEEPARDYAAETREEARYERELEEWEKETVTERKKLRREGYEPLKPKKPLFTTVRKAIGTVSLPSLFTVTESPRAIVAAIVEQFQNLVGAHQSVGAWERELYAWQGRRDASRRATRVLYTVGNIEVTFKQITTLLDKLEQQIDRLLELQSFFQPATLHTMVAWATQTNLAGTYRTGLGALTFLPTEDPQVTVQLPRDYVVPSKRPIEQFRAAMNKPS